MDRSGRLPTLKIMADEFYWRARPLRWLARACVGRPFITRLTVGALLAVAQLANWIHLQAISSAAYSAIFNLCYWQSVSEQLGGHAAFWQLVAKYQPSLAK